MIGSYKLVSDQIVTFLLFLFKRLVENETDQTLLVVLSSLGEIKADPCLATNANKGQSTVYQSLIERVWMGHTLTFRGKG
jgi:hypothetical protein